MNYFHTERLMAEREQVDAITLDQGKGYGYFDSSIQGGAVDRMNVVAPVGTILKLPIFVARKLIQSNRIAVLLPGVFRPSERQFLLVDPPLINMRKLGMRAFYNVARFYFWVLQSHPKLCLVAETKEFQTETPEVKEAARNYIQSIMTEFWFKRRKNIYEKGVACDTHLLLQNPTLQGQASESVVRESIDALKMKLSDEERRLLSQALLETKATERYFRKLDDANNFQLACLEDMKAPPEKRGPSEMREGENPEAIPEE